MEKNDCFSMDSALLKIEKLSDAAYFLLNSQCPNEKLVAGFLLEIILKVANQNQLRGGVN